MRKTVEVEYVGIEDLQDILDDAYALMKEGHYVAFRMSNSTNISIFVSIDIYMDGWAADKNADYSYCFYIDDKEDNVEIMNECKNTLKKFIGGGIKNEIIRN